MYFSVSIEMTAAASGPVCRMPTGLMPPFSSERPATIQTESAVRVLRWPKANRPVIGMTAVVSITRRGLCKHLQFAYVCADFIFIFEVQAVYSHCHPHQVLRFDVEAFLMCRVDCQMGAGNENIHAERLAECFQFVNTEFSRTVYLAETAFGKVIHGKGCRQVCIHYTFHQQRVRIEEFLSQPGEVHLSFHSDLDSRIPEQVGYFGLHIQ